MKETIHFAIILTLFASCSDVYSVYKSPGHIDWYEDDFRNTKTVKLEQKYLATSAQTIHAINTTLSLQKQLTTSNQKTILKLKLNTDFSETIQPKFFFQVDDERFEFPFEEINNHRLKKEKLVVETTEDGSSTEKTYDESKNLVKTTFTLPLELQQKIIHAKKILTIRFYIDDVPYNINLQLSTEASRMTYIHDFLKIKTENDYIRHRQQFARYYYDYGNQSLSKRQDRF